MNKTRSFPKASIWERPGARHDGFQHLPETTKKKEDNVRIEFDLDKLKDPKVAESF